MSNDRKFQTAAVMTATNKAGKSVVKAWMTYGFDVILPARENGETAKDLHKEASTADGGDGLKVSTFANYCSHTVGILDMIGATDVDDAMSYLEDWNETRKLNGEGYCWSLQAIRKHIADEFKATDDTDDTDTDTDDTDDTDTDTVPGDKLSAILAILGSIGTDERDKVAFLVQAAADHLDNLDAMIATTVSA